MNTKRIFPNDSPAESLPSYKDYLHTKETNLETLLAQATPKKPNKPQQQPQNNQQSAEAKPRVFVLVYGDPGKDEHNVGRQHQLVAETHGRELEKGDFPDEGHGPKFRKGIDIIKVVPIHDAGDLVKALGDGNVAYLAYFGHSGVMRTNQDPEGTPGNKRHGAGVLYIGDGEAAGANLTKPNGHKKNVDVSVIPKDKFTEDAQIRLFGCRAGLGHPPIAQQLADHLNVKVYAYISRGGSLFTMDRDLGHGKRELKKGEHELTIGNVPKGTNLWQVTFGAPVDIHNKPVDTDTAWKKFESQVPKKEDTKTLDKQKPDAKTPDAGTSDALTIDAGTLDAQTSDAPTPDAGTPDAPTIPNDSPNDGGMRLGR